MTPLRTIRAITPRSDYRLDVTWADGTNSVADLSADLAGNGVFASLADPQTFNSVRVGERARTIEWYVRYDGVEERLIDIDADALFAMSVPALDEGGEKVPARA